MADHKKLKEFATGVQGPRWMAGLASAGLLVSVLLPVWQQANEVFEFTGTNTTLEENRKHFDEEPIEAAVSVDGVGEVVLQYFPSDRCVRVFRDDSMVARWFTHEDAMADSEAGFSLLPTLLAAVPQGQCIAPEAHRDDPDMVRLERRENMVMVGMEWRDGCAGRVWCHVSGEWCETDRQGRLVIAWDECTH